MKKLRILCLEDNHDDVQLVQRTLKQAGLDPEILNATNRNEFVATMEQDGIDLIISDSSLPGLPSLEAIRMARARRPNTPFLVVSGTKQPNIIARSLEAGAVGFVSKDEPSRIPQAVQQALGSSGQGQRIQQLERYNQAMAKLVSAVQQLSLARDLQSIMAIVRRVARELTGADGATFVLRDKDHCFYADEDAIGPLWKGHRFPANICISGWAMIHREPAVVEDIYTDSRIPIDAYRTTFVKSLVMVPIRTESPIGAIGNYWARRHQPTAEEVELLQALANTTSVAMENVRVFSELEQRVQERTAQLEFANKELEAFSYSVSHDLRAPVRAVMGFGEMLKEDCGKALDEKGRQHLERICASGRKMGQLIEDLIGLSKVSRASVLKQAVDLSGMVREIVAALKASNPARNVECKVQEGLRTHGDPGLLRIVLDNLLSNAWKYSSKTAEAQIEFGTAEENDGETTFLVRDNGAGFDMSYAQGLFAPFQRMHSEHEFPGTGIGLATVQRIIQKHGGRIWVEAAVGWGATFFFTLPGIPSTE